MSNDDNLIDSAKAISKGQAEHFSRNKHWTALGHNILWRSDGAVVNSLGLSSGDSWVARHPEVEGQYVGRFKTQGEACDAICESFPWPPPENVEEIEFKNGTATQILAALEKRAELRAEVLAGLIDTEGWRVVTPWGEGENLSGGSEDSYHPLMHRKTVAGIRVATIFLDGRFRLYDEDGETTEERITGSTNIAKAVVDSLLGARGFIVLQEPEEPK